MSADARTAPGRTMAAMVIITEGILTAREAKVISAARIVTREAKIISAARIIIREARIISVLRITNTEEMASLRKKWRSRAMAS